MKINVFSFTRDRLEYTTTCFNSLRLCKKNIPFDHYVIDNGSTDGTKNYLAKTINSYKGLIISPLNYGLHIASNLIYALMEPCDLVIKFDNDCFIPERSMIKHIVSVYSALIAKGNKYILSPQIKGIVNQPKRGEIVTIKSNKIEYHLGTVGQIGGICMAIPFELFKLLKFNVNLPMARGLDTSICNQAINFGYKLAYIEDIYVEHYETTNGQAKKYPEYFKRKKIEELNPLA